MKTILLHTKISCSNTKGYVADQGSWHYLRAVLTPTITLTLTIILRFLVGQNDTATSGSTTCSHVAIKCTIWHPYTQWAGIKHFMSTLGQVLCDFSLFISCWGISCSVCLSVCFYLCWVLYSVFVTNKRIYI